MIKLIKDSVHYNVRYIIITLYELLKLFLKFHNIMDILESTQNLQQSIINEYGFHAPSYNLFIE